MGWRLCVCVCVFWFGCCDDLWWANSHGCPCINPFISVLQAIVADLRTLYDARLRFGGFDAMCSGSKLDQVESIKCNERNDAMIPHSWQCFLDFKCCQRCSVPKGLGLSRYYQIHKYGNYWEKKGQSAIIVFEPSNPPSNSCWHHYWALQPLVLEAAGFFRPSRGFVQVRIGHVKRRGWGEGFRNSESEWGSALHCGVTQHQKKNKLCFIYYILYFLCCN